MSAVHTTNGLRGNRTETGTTALDAATHGGPWSEIQVLADANFATLTDADAHATANDVMTGFVVPALTILRGNFTAVTLASGKIRLYRGPGAPA